MAMNSAWTHRPQVAGRGKCARHSSGRLIPVAMPTFADRYWTSIAMRFATTMTQTSRKPYFAPPATFVAKLPGSMYAMAATNAGPSSASRPRIGPRARTDSSSDGATGTSSPIKVISGPHGRNFFWQPKHSSALG